MRRHIRIGMQCDTSADDPTITLHGVHAYAAMQGE